MGSGPMTSASEPPDCGLEGSLSKAHLWAGSPLYKKKNVDYIVKLVKDRRPGMLQSMGWQRVRY